MKLIVDITEGNWMAIQDGIWCGSEQIAKGIPFEPCEDAVSRQVALDAIKPMPNDNKEKTFKEDAHPDLLGVLVAVSQVV